MIKLLNGIGKAFECVLLCLPVISNRFVADSTIIHRSSCFEEGSKIFALQISRRNLGIEEETQLIPLSSVSDKGSNGGVNLTLGKRCRASKKRSDGHS